MRNSGREGARIVKRSRFKRFDELFAVIEAICGKSCNNSSEVGLTIGGELRGYVIIMFH